MLVTSQSPLCVCCEREEKEESHSPLSLEEATVSQKIHAYKREKEEGKELNGRKEEREKGKRRKKEREKS